MPDISTGHPIAKAFLPHLRVTTEGKAMEPTQDMIEAGVEQLLTELGNEFPNLYELDDENLRDAVLFIYRAMNSNA
ncbi:hypothetical protein M6B24_06090 [Enterobacter bugandensis]|nr:hypothetical protein [Enterobacter bugandensis]